MSLSSCRAFLASSFLSHGTCLALVFAYRLVRRSAAFLSVSSSSFSWRVMGVLCRSRVMRTGFWSLLPSWFRTSGVAFLGVTLVANARSGVVEASHRLDKTAVGSSGSFKSRSLLSVCQFSTSSPLRSDAGHPQVSEGLLKSPNTRHWLSGSSMWSRERSLSTGQYSLNILICWFCKVIVTP